MPLLRVIAGPDAGKSAEIRTKPLTIGRAPDCGLALTDAHVSLIHAAVERLEHGYRVRDLESSTGTAVNGEHVPERMLLFGDTITVGETTILFGSGDEPVTTGTVGSTQAPGPDGSQAE